MAWFRGRYQETRPLTVSPERAAAHFADPEHIVGATKNVATASVDGSTIHRVLQEEDHGLARFTADYTCTYVRDGLTVRWTAGAGNVRQSGEARFVPTATGCDLAFQETLEMDLPVPRLMARVVKPLVEPMVAKEVRAYLDRLVARLSDA